ncbi:MAG: hypothetical protein ACT4OQ_10095 [Chloroflexota bacterium]
MHLFIRGVVLVFVGFVGWSLGGLLGTLCAWLGHVLLGLEPDLTLPLIGAIVGGAAAVGWTGWRMGSST